jgi:hypothetical protein
VLGVLLASAGFTFVTVQGSEAVNVLIYGGPYLASYPLQIYGSVLRFLFVWLVPLGLAIYIPALGVLGRQGPPGLPAWLAWLAAPAAAAFLAAGALAEGRRRWFQFARDEVSAAELIARLLAGHEVADLTLEEPDIEDIVSRIYRGESPP